MYKFLDIIIILIGIIGFLILSSGIFYSIYDKSLIAVRGSLDFSINNAAISVVGGVLDKITSIPILRIIKNEFISVFAIGLESQFVVRIKANIVCVLILIFTGLNIFLLKDIGQVWYIKSLIATVSLFLPYYIATLLADIYLEKLNRKIPTFIDEFRGAFVKHGKIKIALKESAKRTGGKIGKTLVDISYKTDISEELETLGTGLKNVWFTIFIRLIQNYKSNGGELVDQLYRLNKTMILYINLENKKSRKLIWYEVFAVLTATLSLPAIFWVNYSVLGTTGYAVVDAQGNMMIFRIICFTMLSLVIIRLLRRL